MFERLVDEGFDTLGYRLIPELVAKRYTLDFALLSRKKIDIECDGAQHELIEGIPVIEDVERDEYLRNNGWVVFRVPNRRILTEPDKIVGELRKLFSWY